MLFIFIKNHYQFPHCRGQNSNAVAQCACSCPMAFSLVSHVHSLHSGWLSPLHMLLSFCVEDFSFFPCNSYLFLEAQLKVYPETSSLIIRSWLDDFLTLLFGGTYHKDQYCVFHQKVSLWEDQNLSSILRYSSIHIFKFYLLSDYVLCMLYTSEQNKYAQPWHSLQSI